MSRSSLSGIPAILAAVLFLLLGGCSGGDTFESVKDEYVTEMSAMQKVLERINDRATAEAEAPRLEKIVARVKALNARGRELGDPPAELKKDAETASQGLRQAMMRLAFNSEVMAVLQPIFEKLDDGMGFKKRPQTSGVSGMPDGMASGVPNLAGKTPEEWREFAENMQRSAGNNAGSTQPAVLPGGTLEGETTPPAGAGASTIPGLQAQLARLSDKTASTQDKMNALMNLQMSSRGQLPAEAVPAVAALIDGQDHNVRMLAMTLLGSAGEAASRVAPQIAAAINDPLLGPAAASSLARLGEHAVSALPSLTETLRSSDSMATVSCVFAVLDSMGSEAKSALSAVGEAAKRHPLLAGQAEKTRAKISGQ